MQEFLQQPERQHDNTRIQGSCNKRLEHPIPEKVEEIDFTCNVMKIIEDLKQDVKNCFKETEKTNKNVEEMNKSLEDIQENQEKAIKQVMETVQDLKTEMEARKKIQTKGLLDMENLGK